MARCLRYFAVVLPLIASVGCSVFPEVAHQPKIHNPFPQLAKVAVAPFFNLTTEPTVDGRQFALAYFNELQLIPGFEVVPVGVVEKTLVAYRISLTGADDARRLAQILGVDAVVIGAVTDFSSYYPPRCTLQVEWYAANPGFHTIPPGYGLPWGTSEEEYIPAPLVQEAEFALARAQLKTQTPAYNPPEVLLPPQLEEIPTPTPQSKEKQQNLKPASLQEPAANDVAGAPGVTGKTGPQFPPHFPDGRSFVPDPPAAHPPTPMPTTNR